MATREPAGTAPAWLERVRARLTRWRRAGLGPRWVAAVSGGSDSVGLLRVLLAVGPELGLQLSVAHLDHGVRGEAGAADARFVAQLAESFHLPIDLGQWRPPGAGRFEAEARRARYAWLAEVARARAASVVTVGHTRDDQAETILHRVLRGTGLRGLAGMPARRPLDGSLSLVRPLLGVSRLKIRDYLAALGQDYRDDATNADRTRTRARLRHDLLPRLADEYNPAVAEALVRLGRLAGASQRAWLRPLGRLADRATMQAGPDTVTLRRLELARFPRVVRAEALRLIWRRQGWPEAGMTAARWLHLAGLLRRDQGGGSVGAGVEARLSGDHLCLFCPPSGSSHAANEALALRVGLPVPGSAGWYGDRIVATLDLDTPRDETIDLEALDSFLGFDRGKPAAYLYIRAPQAGDRFEPLGMGGHTMPLNDFLRARRVPGAERRRVPLVYDRSGIVWVVGHRIAHRVRLTAATRRRLGLRWESGGGTTPGTGPAPADRPGGCD